MLIKVYKLLSPFNSTSVIHTKPNDTNFEEKPSLAKTAHQWFSAAGLPRTMVCFICEAGIEWSAKFEPPHGKTNKFECVPSKDSDQPGHQPSLIRVFPVHMKEAWVLSYPLNAQPRLWMPMLIWVFAGRTFILLVLSWGGSNNDSYKPAKGRVATQLVLCPRWIWTKLLWKLARHVPVYMSTVLN